MSVERSGSAGPTERSGGDSSSRSNRRDGWRSGGEQLPTSTAGTVPPNASVVTFTLEAQGRGTRVTVTESPGVLTVDAPLAMAEHD